MRGLLTTNPSSLTVVGGGISGLLLAYAATTRGIRTHVLEARDRLGGVIKTDHLVLGLSEAAANSLLVNAEVEALCEALSLPLVRLDENAKARYIVRDGTMRRFPLSLTEAASLGWRLCFAKAEGDEHTFSQWGTRFLGEGPVEYGLNPFFTGVYAARPHELSVEAIAPSFKVPEGKTLFSVLRNRPKKKAPRSYMAIPEGGMESLVKALARAIELSGYGTIEQSSTVDSIPDDENVALCVPASVASHLLKDHCEQSSRALDSVRYSPLVSLTLCYKLEAFSRPPQGTGVLIPTKEKSDVLGILFSSSSFPSIANSSDTVILRVMIGGTGNPEAVTWSDERLVQAAIKVIDNLFTLQQKRPLEHKIYKWKQAVPVYSEKLREVWTVLDNGWCSERGKILSSNYTSDVSIRGMVKNVSSVFTRSSGNAGKKE